MSVFKWCLLFSSKVRLRLTRTMNHTFMVWYACCLPFISIGSWFEKWIDEESWGCSFDTQCLLSDFFHWAIVLSQWLSELGRVSMCKNTLPNHLVVKKLDVAILSKCPITEQQETLCWCDLLMLTDIDSKSWLYLTISTQVHLCHYKHNRTKCTLSRVIWLRTDGCVCTNIISHCECLLHNDHKHHNMPSLSSSFTLPSTHLSCSRHVALTLNNW